MNKNKFDVDLIMDSLSPHLLKKLHHDIIYGQGSYEFMNLQNTLLYDDYVEQLLNKNKELRKLYKKLIRKYNNE
jgi:hypothetical protein